VKHHDELFREMVSDPMARRDMVRICLPDLVAYIELDSVTAIDATFTGGKQADLLVSMYDRTGRERLVYVLVEHKSYHDPLVAVQLYRYLGAIWQQQWINRESEARGPLPKIHPVVFYHGAAPWTAPLELTGLHRTRDSDRGRSHDHRPDHERGAGPESDPSHNPEPFITDLVYRVVDLRTIEPEQLRVAARTLAYMITLRHVLRPFSRSVARMILRFIMAPGVERSTQERLLKYLVETTRDKNTDTLMTEWEAAGYTVEGGDIMTMAQELMRRGEVKGREEGRSEVARKMLERGVAIGFVAETTGLTEDQIAALKNENTKNTNTGNGT
jgi:predicted transposase YdaD